MPENPDPFTGRWRFNPELSRFRPQPPSFWAQEVLANAEEIQVREKIVRSDGSEIVASVQARFDGRDYPVEGHPLVDTIAYTRVDRNTISGTGKKNGAITLTETVTASPADGTYTLRYSIHTGGEIVGSGVAVFERGQ